MTNYHIQSSHPEHSTWQFSACYDINTEYLGIIKNATMAVEFSTTKFGVCQEANGQFCSINTPFLHLANPPSCVTALYARSMADITSVFIANVESIRCKFANPDITRCLDPYDPTFCPSKHHDADMS